MLSRWDEGQPCPSDDKLADLVDLSHLIAKEPHLTQPGGGNTSLKLMETDWAGRRVEALRIKGSGRDLATIDPSGFSWLRLEELRLLRNHAAMSDEEMMAFLAACRLDPGDLSPSLETPLH